MAPTAKNIAVSIRQPTIQLRPFTLPDRDLDVIVPAFEQMDRERQAERNRKARRLRRERRKRQNLPAPVITTDGKPLYEPDEWKFDAYLASCPRQHPTQKKIAELLSNKYAKKIKQPAVHRAIKEVREWLGVPGHKVPAPILERSGLDPVVYVDPAVLDQGTRTDHRRAKGSETPDNKPKYKLKNK